MIDHTSRLFASGDDGGAHSKKGSRHKETEWQSGREYSHDAGAVQSQEILSPNEHDIVSTQMSVWNNKQTSSVREEEYRRSRRRGGDAWQETDQEAGSRMFERTVRRPKGKQHPSLVLHD